MMQLNNRTPFAVETMIFPNPDGVDTLYTIVKATFEVGSQWRLAEQQRPPQDEDEYWGEPGESSLKYGSDFHTGKIATDIVVIGNAIAPEGRLVRQLDVGVAVGDLQKVIRVHGNRVWHNGFATKPEEFQSMPIIYENAFGGQSFVDDELKSLERRNPVGKGYKGKLSREEMQGQALPNIEDPRDLIQNMSDTPNPAGFGFCAPHWLPRANYGGTYDDQWQESKAPFLPKDYDMRFQSAASPGLIYPGFIAGGERVKIVNMHSGGKLDFTLPRIKIKSRLSFINSRAQDMKFNVESLIIEPNTLGVQLTWKSINVCGNYAPKIKSIDLKLSRAI